MMASTRGTEHNQTANDMGTGDAVRHRVIRSCVKRERAQTEAKDRRICGRGALQWRRSMTGRTCGAAGRENAGVSSGTMVRIHRTENPRIPEEGSSALGKSGTKARPKGVVEG